MPNLHRDAFIFHTDPGHGWLEVSDADLSRVGLQPADFTAYSFKARDGKPTFYLEEDCDAPKFIAAHTAMYGKPTIVENYADNNGRIRNYPRIK